jgi:hypothetical protein
LHHPALRPSPYKRHSPAVCVRLAACIIAG